MNKNNKLDSRLVVLLGLILTLAGCEALGPELGVKRQLQPLEDIEQADWNANAEVFDQLGNSELSESRNKTVMEEYIGTGKFIAPQRTKSSKSGGDGKYTLNFDGADLREVTKIILSDMLGKNYVINPKVRGEVTLQTTRPLTRSELLPTLEMLLRMNSVALVKEHGIYRIEPSASALQGGGIPGVGVTGKLPPGYQIRIVPLRYVGVNDMEEILRPIMPSKGILRKDGARNLLMLAGTASELQRILETIKIFDVNVMEGMSFGLYPLENIDVMDVIGELEKLFDKDAKNPLAGMFKFVPIERLNAVMIITPQPEYLREIKKWVLRLDRTDSVAGEGVIVYRVQHVIATELASTLESVFSGTGQSSRRNKAKVAPGRQLASISINNTNASGQKRRRSTNAKKSPGGKNSMDLSNVRVIADEPNNALVIMARPQQFKIIETIIKQLDVMPLQVLINADIFEVRLTDDLNYGVKWIFENSLPGGHKGVGLFGLAKDAALAGATGGFSYAVLNSSDNVRIIVDMLAKTNKINVISSPTLMVLNNQQASIKVGDQVPVRLGSTTNNNGTTENISMRDTGVKLNITPRVNAGGIVIMEIDQSFDQAQKTEVSSIDSPTILQRKIQTSVAVTSGETIVLGGLISEDHEYTKSGIPFLKDLPWIGDLFAQTAKKKIKDELIVLITPSVIGNKYDARKVTREFQKKLTGIFEDLPVKAKMTESKQKTTHSEP